MPITARQLALLGILLCGCFHDLRSECLAVGKARDIQRRMAACDAAHRYNERDPEVIAEIAIQYFLDGRTKEAWQLIDKLAVQKDDDERKFTASVLGLIGVRFYQWERYIEAESMQRHSITLFKQRPANKKPDAAIISNLYNLALTNYTLGRKDSALELINESISRFDEVKKTALMFKSLFFGDFDLKTWWPISKQGLYVRWHMHNLRAGIYEAKNDLETARAEYQEALRIAELAATEGTSLVDVDIPRASSPQSSGSMSVYVADLANNLARVNLALGAPDVARKYAERALGIREFIYSSGHIEIMRSLQVLALIDIVQGNSTQAAKRLSQASEIAKNSLGSYSIELASLLHNQAVSALVSDQLQLSISALKNSLNIQERRLRYGWAESEILEVRSLFYSQDMMSFGIPIALRGHAEFRELAVRTAFLTKGRTQDAMTQVAELLRAIERNPELSSRRETLVALQAEQSRELRKTEQNTRRLAELSEQIDQRSEQLVREVPSLRATRLPDPDQIVSAVAQRLPPRSVLIDFELAVVPKELTAAALSPDGAKHYVALLLFPDQRIEAVDLGPSATVESSVSAFMSAMQSPTSDAQPAANALYDHIFRPVRPFLTEVTHVYLAVDGVLSMVPFSALHDGSRYLVNSYAFRYLSSARDLLQRFPARSTQPAVLLADPDFRAGWDDSIDNGNDSAPATPLLQLAKQLAALPRLPGAQREVDAVAQHMKAHVYTDKDAREELLRTLQAPWVLHIASHGLFLKDLPGTVNVAFSRSAFHVVPQAIQSVSPMVTQQQRLSLAEGIREMNNAALVLAGAARGVLQPDTETNGVLTALKARQLNLHGTQLVVLSACETGRGAISIGQGVYGLRRGFLAAGAETVLASQWRVDDTATSELMSTFYEHLLHPETPLSRLSALQRAMLETKQKHPHPHYWAPFVLIGEDGPVAPPRGP